MFEILNLSTNRKDSARKLSLHYSIAQRSFIDKAFQKYECIQFVPSVRDPTRCGCGRILSAHRFIKDHHDGGLSIPRNERWSIQRHTEKFSTDAYGTIEFLGGPHPHKAQYVRLGFDSDPEAILQLFEKVWGIDRPKLVISVHGGIANFHLQKKLAAVFRKGLLKAAKTTGAWIITSGLNAGVVRHVANALVDGGSSTSRQKKKIVTIGIAPWGLLKKREEFLGREITVSYHPQAFSPKGRFAVLNDKHSYFLLVDNGTVARYGADIILRKRFEEFLCKQTIESSGKRVPVVCVVLEGGACTIRSVLDYVTMWPPVPVVVCDGSGRAADLIAFTHFYAQDDGQMPIAIKDQLISLIRQSFDYNFEQAEKVLKELLCCVRNKHLITVFRLGEESTQDIDHAILTALLKGQDLPAPDQLSLTLTWNRPDIAKSDIFVYGQEWPSGALENAMMDALMYDRVDFVSLLLQNGVSMQKFLTVERLEQLYNTDKGPTYSREAFELILKDVVKYQVPKHHRIKIHEVGLVMQKLMGGAYNSYYCSKEFRKKFNGRLQQNQRHSAIHNKIHGTGKATTTSNNSSKLHPSKSVGLMSLAADEDSYGLHKEENKEVDFLYPFNELLIWAVLMRRQEMALCMFKHGEEALAKSIVACHLYKSMAREAEEDYLEAEICEELLKYSEEFSKLANELLDVCYQNDDDFTYRLLTYELTNWGYETCLSLAYLANQKGFLSHPGCQILLADLWHGGMRIRKNTNLKVVLGILLPPTIFWLEFKTKEELLLQPQTKEEHIDVIREDDEESHVEDADDSDVEGGATSSIAGSVKSGAFLPRREASRTSLMLKQLNPLRQRSTRDSRSSDSESGPAVGKVNMNQNLSAQQLTEDTKSPNGSVGTQLNSSRLKEPIFLPPFATITTPRQRSLKIGRKLYEFYKAPITTFWFFVLSYICFLTSFTYVVLVRSLPMPEWPEYYVIVYIATYCCELVRKFLMTEASQFYVKFVIWAQRRWNLTSFLACIFFLIGVTLRFTATTSNAARLIYAVDITYWYIHVLDLLSVNKNLGPYITMVAKMVLSMLYITTILLMLLLAFGVLRESILFPNREWNWQMLRNVMYKPYFMLYGEVYAGEIDTCGDNGTNCVPGYYIVPAFQSAFLLFANILLINLMIATFNNVYLRINTLSQQVWKFQRYSVVMEYEQKPFLPPPLIIFNHLHLIVKWICRRRKRSRRKTISPWIQEYQLKLFLDPEEIERLHDFEEALVDDLIKKREAAQSSATEERVRRTFDRVEYALMKLDEMTQKQQSARMTLQSLEMKFKTLEDVVKKCFGSETRGSLNDLANENASNLPHKITNRRRSDSPSDNMTPQIVFPLSSSSSQSQNYVQALVYSDPHDNKYLTEGRMHSGASPVQSLQDASADSKPDQLSKNNELQDNKCKMLPTIAVQTDIEVADEKAELSPNSKSAVLISRHLSVQIPSTSLAAAPLSPRHDHYTAITDAIDLSCLNQQQSPSLRYHDDSYDDNELPPAMRRTRSMATRSMGAQSSDDGRFRGRQKSVSQNDTEQEEQRRLREFEESASQITAQLVRARVRRESESKILAKSSVDSDDLALVRSNIDELDMLLELSKDYIETCDSDEIGADSIKSLNVDSLADAVPDIYESELSPVSLLTDNTEPVDMLPLPLENSQPQIYKFEKPRDLREDSV